jgi:flagellar hook-associated protein 3 FlgL
MTRIANLTLGRNVLTANQNTLVRLANLQEQLATGKRINRLSDDPGAGVQAMRFRAESFQLGKYLDNISKCSSFLDAYDGTYGEMTQVMNEAKKVAVAGANDTQDASSRRALADNIDAQLSRMVELANSSYDGRFLFSGTQTLERPFAFSEDRSTVTYQGNLDTFAIKISPTASMAINRDGNAAFKDPVDAFAALIELRDALRANDRSAIGASIATIDAAHTSINDQHGELGSHGNRLELTRNQLEATRLSLDELVSRAEDTDFAATISDLQVTQNALEAGLQAGARIVQQSLLNYL